MREHEVNQMDNFICGFYGISDEVCDSLVQYHENSEDKRPGVTINGVDITQKYSIDVGLTNSEIATAYCKELQLVVDEYIKKYPYCNKGCPWKLLQAINIQKYDPGWAYFGWHTERTGDKYPSCNRHLVFMTYLNDVTDAGETEFLHQKLKIKPEKGLTLIWPTDWTFTHRGVPSMSQEKYITTGWFNYVS
jgi:hypothetical protein